MEELTGELEYLQSVKKQFEYHKMLGEKTFYQLEEKDFFWQYNEESNSIAIIVNHLWETCCPAGRIF